MDKIKVYLAGCTRHTLYRDYCKSDPFITKHFILNDPIHNTLTIFAENHLDFNDVCFKKAFIPTSVRSQIVKEDKDLILQSDCLVAYIEQPTFGTIMEIMFAYIWKLPVYAILPLMNYTDDVWLSYHSCAMFKDINNCFEYVLMNNKRKLEERRSQ